MTMNVPAPVLAALDASGVHYEVIACDPELADTATFSAHYGYPLADSANAILVNNRKGERTYVVCVLLASTRLDINTRVRKRLAVRKVSLTPMAEAEALTGMTSGGITPVGLPPGFPIWVDHRVMARDRIILGAGSRSAKIITVPKLFDQLDGVELVQDLALE